ncbi:MAG: class I SAM-dependent methyltransferase [Prolixibacteraceae bacterium]|nr:class I SAM-dependent methyltransferase [Prolixibacteraceae bacterium]
MGKTYISVGDFIDLYYKIQQKGYSKIVSKFSLSGNERTATKWNTTKESSDFWVIPEVRSRWNEKCTGDTQLEYEDYVVQKYFSNQNGLKLLSVGCGSGARERKFAKYPVFSSIEGIDLAGSLIEKARKEAGKQQFNNIKYHVGNFLIYDFEPGSFDVILFNSSLHHFDRIDCFLETKVLPLLKEKGHLIVFEYAGPNRLQWSKSQLIRVNEILKEIPEKYRVRIDGKSVKKRAYRPGLIRMKLVDPSEAVDSESIVPSLHKHFNIVEEREIGWDITHVLFKDIAHNFLNDDPETKKLIRYIFEQEDNYLQETGHSDTIFGLYQKPIN